MKGEVILLPGMVCDQTVWLPQIQALDSVWTCRVAAYPHLDSIGAMAESVLAWAPQRFAIAGHSMGGRVAQEIVSRAPERVSGLALLGTDFRGPRDQQERECEAAARLQDIELIRREGFATFAQGWARKLIAAKRRADLGLIETIVAMTMRHGISSLEAHGRAGLSRPDYTELLGKITCPTLICAGEEDAARPVGPHRMMAAAIADSRLVVLEQCGHMMTLESAAEVSGAMRAWLERVDSSEAG